MDYDAAQAGPRGTAYRSPARDVGAPYFRYCKELLRKGLKYCGRLCYRRYSVEVAKPVEKARVRLVEMWAAGLSQVTQVMQPKPGRKELSALGPKISVGGSHIESLCEKLPCWLGTVGDGDDVDPEQAESANRTPIKVSRAEDVFTLVFSSKCSPLE